MGRICHLSCIDASDAAFHRPSSCRFTQTWTAEGLTFDLEVPKQVIGIEAAD